jgi:Concanavalin A-like lectin/glucanases superfamily
MLSINASARNNWFADSSASGHGVTQFGGVTQSNEGAGVVAASFIGNTQLLVINDPVSNFNYLTGNFTLEAFVKVSAFSATVAGGAIFATPLLSNAGYAFNTGESVTRLRMTSDASGSWTDNIVASNGCTLNTWVHLAFVRNGINITIYRNGISVATSPLAVTYSFNQNSSKIAKIGAWRPSGGTVFYSDMKIAGLRVTNTAVYTAPFTAPTTLPTAITGTQLLMNFGGTAAPIV